MVERAPNKELSPKRRVVVTGIGMVTPLGLNVKESWENLIAGKSGITPRNSEYTKEIKVAGQIHDFDSSVSGIFTNKDQGRISRPTLLAVSATREALKDAGLLTDKDKLTKISPHRIGVRIGTGIGGAPEIAEVYERQKEGKRISPFSALRIEPERVASVVSMTFGTKGVVTSESAACATGNIAITDGAKDIFVGDSDIMITGGTESMFSNEAAVAIYNAVHALSKDDSPRASRPFNNDRNGFVMGEGAGVVILEEYQHALKRGAKILAELSAYANTADAKSDTEPSGVGSERAMRIALGRAGKIAEKGNIYFNAHATATPIGDRRELLAIKRVLGGRDYGNFSVSSTKGATAHLMGAAGAVEAIFSIKALNEEVVPPTINLEKPLRQRRQANLVPIDAQKRKVDLVVNNSFGFGGINSTTVFAIPED